MRVNAIWMCVLASSILFWACADQGGNSGLGPDADADVGLRDAPADLVSDTQNPRMDVPQDPGVDVPPDVPADTVGQDVAIDLVPDVTIDASDTSIYPDEAIVYAHGPTTLYGFDPDTQVISTIGEFSGCEGSVIDLAVDKDQNIFVTTSFGLYTVDATSAACSLVASGSYPNSLSFLPEGTLLQNEEALVGYLSDSYIRIDRNNGTITTIGALTGGYYSSGDIVSVKNGGTYLTVYGNGCSDCLFQVDPVTGDLLRDWGTINHASVYGLAYWGGTAYGFNNDGVFFSIEFDENAGTVSTTDLPFPMAPPNLQFYGAGSTTIAPVIN